MKSIVFICLLVFTTSLSVAQFQVQYVEDTTDQKSARFPILSSTASATIAKKINDHLQTWQFGQPIKGSFHSGIQADEYTCEVIANTPRIVSFDINYGYCGCGCHYTFQTISYDARTGEQIAIEKVVTPQGLSKLRQYMLGEFRKKVKAISANPAIESFKEEYAECLNLDEWKNASEMPYDRWILTPTGLGFWGGWCLDGSSWNADEARLHWDLPFEQIWFALTPYGLNLLTGTTGNDTSPLNVVLHGKIDNKYPISVLLVKGSGFISYDKYGTPIRLDVELLNGKYVMHELDEKGGRLSDIDAAWDGKSLTGTFKSLKSGKVMTFAASR